MLNLKKVFDKYNDREFLRFERVESPLSERPDLCAFLLLDSIAPGKSDMVSGADHDEIWLFVDTEALAEKATEEQILTLVRCGIMYDEEFESLAMFV
jgi:hypothetical protein